MIKLINFITIFSLILIGLKLVFSQNIYEKIVSFYFQYNLIIILILANNIFKSEYIIDIVLLLFLLELTTILFLLFNKKKI